jgi:hypothetical protein
MSNFESPSKLLLEETSPQGFFHEKVKQAQKRQGLALSEDMEFYIVQLLADYVTLNSRENSLQSQTDCLALILKQALESDHHEQIHLFKKLGDTALYFSGFFQEYFNNKCFDVSYYISMGGNAYGNLAGILKGGKSSYASSMSKTYEQLSTGFTKAVDVIMDVSEHTTGVSQTSKRSTLSLYDSWLSTASTKLEKDLLDRGVIPVPVLKKWRN